MVKKSFSDALAELRSRNVSIAATYRDWGKRLPPGPATRLAMSLAEQRLDLGKALGEIASDYGLPGVQVEFELAPAEAPGAAAGNADISEPVEILKMMVSIEAAEHELLAAVAGAAVAASTEIAERLASEAASAQKRSNWARDQLDLLDMLHS
jgi:hypothetical protein